MLVLCLLLARPEERNFMQQALFFIWVFAAITKSYGIFQAIVLYKDVTAIFPLRSRSAMSTEEEKCLDMLENMEQEQDVLALVQCYEFLVFEQVKKPLKDQYKIILIRILDGLQNKIQEAGFEIL